MQLSEMIYQLRTRAGMSQGDLAEKLEISRQSVSKWETGGAVPDLDKLVKISELFEISLDELVKGESGQPKEENDRPEPQVIYEERAESNLPRRNIAGWLLFGFAGLILILCTILGGLLAGLLLSVPFWVCGTICMMCKQRPGLWCSWAVYVMTDLYLRVATGLSWGNFFTLLRNFIRNDMALIISAVLSLLVGILVWMTVRSFRGQAFELTKGVKIRFGIKTAALVACCLPWTGWIAMRLLEVTERETFTGLTLLMQVGGAVRQWGQVILFTWLLIDLFAIRRWKKTQIEG